MAELSLVYRAFNENERDLFNSFMESVHVNKEKVNLDQDYLEKVNLNRVLSSSTLKKMEELSLWDQANIKLHNLLGKPLTFSMIVDINKSLTDSGGLREAEVYGSGFRYLTFEKLENEILHFDRFLKESHLSCPLEKAFRVYVWICSAHPFRNGNGRTARLVADKILLENGYLPLCFPNSATSHVAYFEELQNECHLQKIKNFFIGISRAYEL